MPIHDWTRVEAGIFHDFHHEWISTIKHALNAGLLPDGYYALAEQVAGRLESDVLTLDVAGKRPAVPPAGRAAKAKARHSPVATLTKAPPRVRFTASAESPQRRKQPRIAIRHVSGFRVVAMIEIVSPGNKHDKEAIGDFIRKAADLLDAGVHLLILDLFPPTKRDPQGIHGAIWRKLAKRDFELPSEQPLTLVAYTGGRTKHAYIQPVAVGESLPEMPLFLDSETYVRVPLEPAYRAAFDAVPKPWREQLDPPT